MRGANNSAQLAAARARIAELETEIARLSARDPLVASLLTLPSFRAQLELDVKRAQRHKRPLAVAVLDIDRFRQLNMARGYAVGDMVLAAVGQVLAANTRAHDLACRSAGDEFILMLPETDGGAARAVVSRILAELSSLEAADQRGVSVSAGIATLQEGDGADALLGHAHAALALARSEGGARVIVSDAAAAPLGSAEPAASSPEVVAVLSHALEDRDRYAGERSASVVDLAGHVAEALALEPPDMTTIRSAALLHDIGKVGIPDEILHKAGPLDDEEWEIMRQHPVIGERVLHAIPGMGEVARIVRHKHERWDGSGYPDGLAGEAIPLGSRIVAACDAYHAVTSDRPYRRALSHQLALAELNTNAGSQFDPSVVAALVKYLSSRRMSLAAV